MGGVACQLEGDWPGRVGSLLWTGLFMLLTPNQERLLTKMRLDLIKFFFFFLTATAAYESSLARDGIYAIVTACPTAVAMLDP